VPDDGRQVLSIPATTHGRVLVRHAPTEPPRGILAGFHGYMENAAAQLARLETLPGAEAWTLVSIQGLHRFYRGRSQDVVASWMTREDRETTIAVTGAASPPIVYAGFSQGVAMAFRAAVRAQQPAAGVIAVGGDVPPELLADVALKFPRVFLARGAADDWYTAVKLETDAAALRARGTDVRELVYAGGHEWTPEIAEAAAAWLGL
jgi:predicted esterase